MAEGQPLTPKVTLWSKEGAQDTVTLFSPGPQAITDILPGKRIQTATNITYVVRNLSDDGSTGEIVRIQVGVGFGGDRRLTGNALAYDRIDPPLQIQIIPPIPQGIQYAYEEQPPIVRRIVFV